MKAHVLGFEISQGIVKKDGPRKGQPYAIGRLHVALPLAPAFGGEGNLTKGSQGTTYDVEVSLLDKIKHLPCPFEAELEQQDVIRFNERRQQIVSVVPLRDQSHLSAPRPATPAPAVAVAR